MKPHQKKKNRKKFKRVYSENSLLVLRAFIKSSIKEQLGLPLDVYEDLEELEKAVSNLPMTTRRAIELFFGLIPNTPIKALLKIIAKKQALSLSLVDQSLEALANEGIASLRGFDYLCKYDSTIQKILGNIIKGNLIISDVDALKYVFIFLMFFDKIVDEQKLKLISESSINLEFLVKVLQMLDIHDVAVMKSTVRLPLDEFETEKQVSGLKSFKEVQDFRQNLFPKGDWNLVKSIFYGTKFDKEKVFSILEEGLEETIDGIRITDLYEVYCVYSARKVW